VNSNRYNWRFARISDHVWSLERGHWIQVTVEVVRSKTKCKVRLPNGKLVARPYDGLLIHLPIEEKRQ